MDSGTRPPGVHDVLYSPGAGEPRTWGTTLVQDLASRGYVVVTVDPTYEASEVEFPGGRIVTSVLQAELAKTQRNFWNRTPGWLLDDPARRQHSERLTQMGYRVGSVM